MMCIQCMHTIMQCNRIVYEWLNHDESSAYLDDGTILCTAHSNTYFTTHHAHKPYKIQFFSEQYY